jgi:hypothetical protein
MVGTCIAHRIMDVSVEGFKRLVLALSMNFGLEATDMFRAHGHCYMQSIENISRLSKAGRRWLLTNPSIVQRVFTCWVK